MKRLLLLLLALAAAYLVYQYPSTPKTNAEPRTEAVEASAGQTAVQTAKATDTPDTEVTAAAEPAPIQNIPLDEPPPIIRGANNRLLFEEARTLERTTLTGALYEEDVFQVAKTADIGSLAVNEHTLAAIEVHVDPAQIRAFIASGAERIRLPLPNGRSDILDVEEVITRGVHTYTLRGRLESDPLSEATIVFHDGAVSGAIADQANNLHYKIGMSGDGDVVIRLLDLATLPHGCGVGADELVAPGGTGAAITEGDAYDTPVGATVMDSVIGYGQGARVQEGGVAAIEATIVLGIDTLNEAILNSEAGNNFVSLLATIEDPDYVFPGVIDGENGSSDELGYLDTHGDGILDTVSQLRIDLGADQNGFVTKQPDTSPGVAKIGGRSMIVGVNYINTFNNSFSHEFGHNLSCMHAFGDTEGYTNRSDYGWRFDPVSTNGRSTIMAYTMVSGVQWGNGGRVNYFSNPAVQYDGVSTGAVDGYDASADTTVDPDLVNHPTSGSGYDGTHPSLGANNAQEIIDNTATMAARATRTALGVTDPVAAITWTANQPYSIFWTGGDHTDTVSIDLYKGGVLDSNIASGLSGQNRWYTWTIPDSQAAGSDYTVRVTLNGSTYSESAAFTILEAPFTGVIWDGDTNSRWNIATNWSGDLVPSSSDDVVVNSSTSFRGTGAWILDSLGDGQFGTLSLSVADIGIRGNGNLSMYGDMTFTSSFTGTSGGSTTFSPNTTSAFGLIATSSQAIINNGTGASAVVSFAGPTAARTFDFSGDGGADTLSFGGSNNFSLGALVAVDEATLERVWTTDTFSGTLTLNGDANFMDPSIDVRIQSGTVNIAANEQIGDSTIIAFGTVAGASGTLDARGITETAGVLNNFSDATASLAILADISTSLTFANFNDGGLDRGDIDVQGWVEGNSSLIFTSLINYDWTVAEGEAFVGLTIGGQPAYMTQVADVNGDTVADWAVTATFVAPLLIDGLYTLTGDNQIDDNTLLELDGGTLNLNGYSDSIGSLTMLSDSTIDLNSGGSIAFADSSAIDWGHAVLFIDGTLAANSIRFGTSDTALTMEQQSLIRVNGQKARLDANGYLKTITERTESGFQVIGFSRISDQFGTPVVDDMSYYAPLTELIFIPVTPIPATGAIDSSAFTTEIREHLMAAKKAQEGMRVRLSVAGKWDTGDFNFVIDPSLRATFVQNLLELVLSTGMDGADYDWEYPSYQTEQYLAAYDDLINDTKTAFAPYGLDVTLDTNSWAGDVGAASVNDAYAAADRVYDMTYFDLNDTRTSLIRYEEQRGLNRSKVAFGVPFYARNYANKQIGERKYRSIVTSTDLVSKPVQSWNNFYSTTSAPGTVYFFNNIDLIQLQTRMLMDSGAGGIMIWDLFSDYWEGTHPDYPGVSNLSLLNAIGEVVDTWTPSSEVSYNGGFDVMLEGWETLVEGSSSADLTVAHDTNSALNGAFSARVDVTTAGSTAEDARFSQVFEVEADKAYKMTFTAKSGGASLNLPVSLLRYESYFTQYGASLQAETYSVGSTASTHSFFFETDTTEFLRLTFDLGLLSPGSTLYLDDVLVEEVPYITTTSELSGSQPDTVISLVGGTTLSGSGTARKIASLPLASVAPGSSATAIGTVSVVEDIQMPLSSTFKVDANRSGASFSNDLIAVGGNVHFFGTIDLYLDGEPLQVGDEITVLTGNVAMPTYRDVPAQVVVDPASPTPLPAGLQLKTVYYSDKITVLAQNAPAANALRNGEFEQGLFFWDTSASGGSATFSIDSSVPDSGPTCLRIDVTSTGANWPALELFQHFRVESGQQYTISFRYRVSAQNTGDTNELAVGLSNSKLTRDFTNPAIGTFGPQGINAPSINTWHSYSRTFTAGATDAASWDIRLGLAEAGTTIWIDDARITTTGDYPPAASDFTVLGYIPAYRFGANDLITTNPEFFQNLDVLVYGFIMTDANGGLLPYYQQAGGGTVWNYTQPIENTLQTIKADYGLELLVAIGGGGVDETVFFADVISDPAKRATLITNLITFCNAEGFDGVDMDYEYAAAGTNQQENYELFVEEAKAAFTGAKTGGGDLALTAAVDTFARAYLPPEAYTAHRSNHIMGYAMDFDAHVQNIFELFNAGAPMASIYPGVIWAGDNGSGSTAYNNIVDTYAPARYDNTAGEWTFNGIDAVRQKIQLARALGCGGIMIWELGHDIGDPATSLIRNALEDADGDALLDNWEQTHSGGINLRTFSDDDGDGLGNLWENLTNTDPLDGGSQAAPVPQVSGSAFSVQFPYIHTARFNIFAEWTADLTDPGGWTPVEDGVNASITPDAANSTYTIELYDPIGVQPTFIRVGTQIQ